MKPLFLVLIVAAGSIVVAFAAPRLRFVDVTASSGIGFHHNNGAFGSKYMPETFGSGVIWLDVEGDGRQDLLFVNSTHWPERNGPDTHAALYQNQGDGTFADITSGSGLDIPIYGIGGTAADFDNDGAVDVYLTALGENKLFKGHGDGTFTDITALADVGDPGFSTSAVWFDYNRDGQLDLFVANYIA